MAGSRSSRRTARTHAATTAVAAALAIGVLAGCSSDGERATTSSTTTPLTRSDLARQACTEVLDERSELVSKRSTEAVATLRQVLEDRDVPDDDAVDEVRDALGAELGQLADAQTMLREVELPPADRADWDVVVESVGPLLAGLDATVEFLRDPDWSRTPDAVGMATPTPDRVAVDEALDRLDLLGSDCEWVYLYPGDPSAAAPFHREAAAACAVTVERRRRAGFDPSTATAGERADERRATDADLATVEAGSLDDPAPWERFVAGVTAATDATDPDGGTGPVDDDLSTLGLDQRPCAALV